MLFEKFLGLISRFVPSGPLLRMQEKVAELNPEKIYIENVRHLLDVSAPSAERICETAVRQGVFDRGVEVLDPDGNVVLAVVKPDILPTTVNVWVEESGNLEQVERMTTALKHRTFYRLHDQSETRLA